MLKKLLLGLVSILATALGVEAAIQLFPELLPERHQYRADRIAKRNARTFLDIAHRDEPHVHHRRSDTFRHHPRFGWLSAPDLKRTIWGYDGRFRVETNHQGFRDVAPPPTPDVPRVMVLGDSFVWGVFLDQEELMPVRLEEELRVSGFDVDVQNFGMAGYGTDQELLVLREYGPRVRPSLVVLVFFYTNDFSDNTRRERAAGGHAKPFFSIDRSGDLVLNGMPVPEPPAEGWQVPIERSPGYRDLKRRSVLLTLAETGRRRGRVTPSRPTEAERNQRHLTRRLLLELQAEAENLGAALTTVIFPGYGYSRGQQQDYLDTVRFFAEELPELDVLDLTPAFESSPAPLFGRFEEHWTAEGAQLVASEIARHVERHHAAALSVKTR